MLSNAPVAPTIPVTDIKRSKDFYVKKLGLVVENESDLGVLLKAGGDTHLYLYRRGPSKTDHTLASFQVDDLEKYVDDLTMSGVVFEQYDIPGIMTNEKGIAVSEQEGVRGAWFKDPDGNILSLGEEI